MDTSDPDISFDKNGFCNHCSNYFKSYKSDKYQELRTSDQLDLLVKNIKLTSKQNSYDCLLGISGGVDSSYAALTCARYGLRPLLFHVDNGWNNILAVKNINTIVDKLGFDFESIVLDWEVFKSAQLAFLASSSVDLEMPTDLAIHACTLSLVKKYKVPYIISGGNLKTEGILPLSWGYHQYRDISYYKAIVYRYSQTRKLAPCVSLLEEALMRLLNPFKTFYLLNYQSTSREQMKEELSNELGWRDYGGKHFESRITAFWQGKVMPEKYGMDYRRATLSSQVCAGVTTRDDALNVLKQKAWSEDKTAAEVDFISRKFGISTRQFIDYLSLPPKTYKDFSNNKSFIQGLFMIYRSVFT